MTRSFSLPHPSMMMLLLLLVLGITSYNTLFVEAWQPSSLFGRTIRRRQRQNLRKNQTRMKMFLVGWLLKAMLLSSTWIGTTTARLNCKESTNGGQDRVVSCSPEQKLSSRSIFMASCPTTTCASCLSAPYRQRVVSASH